MLTLNEPVSRDLVVFAIAIVFALFVATFANRKSDPKSPCCALRFVLWFQQNHASM